MTQNGVMAASGRLTDWVSLGVLAASVPRDAVDDAVAAAGKQARRSDGKLPPHVMVYFVMAMALFADVICSPQPPVLHVRHGILSGWDPRAGRGYLLPCPSCGSSGGSDACAASGDARVRGRVVDGPGDDDIPVEPVERYLAYLTAIGRSPNTVARRSIWTRWRHSR
jgi:hypothetical protein